MIVCMKAKDEPRLNAIRMIKAALMKERVDSPRAWMKPPSSKS